DPIDLEARAGGFAGASELTDNIHFNSPAIRDRYVGTSPIVGLRLGLVAAPAPTDGEPSPLSGGVEGELTFSPTFTHTRSTADRRMAYLSPYFGYRLHAIGRVGDRRLGVHAFAGVGLLTVVSEAPFVPDDSSIQLYVGGGVDYRLPGAWTLRVDMREAWMP